MAMIRPPSNNHDHVANVPFIHPFDGHHELTKKGQAMSLLALSHTPVEHRLYQVMFTETVAARQRVGSFGIRRLMVLTGLRSYSSIRRGCLGLLNKLSIERVNSDDAQRRINYFVFSPEEVFARRHAAGIALYPAEVEACQANAVFGSAIERIIKRQDLSRREALVTLYCATGLSNVEIGQRLQIGEQTVKFHLRRIFVKFGVRRRTELISRLLTQSGPESR
jgi:DNA-binding CsgD family transcriptional regulator